MVLKIQMLHQILNLSNNQMDIQKNHYFLTIIIYSALSIISLLYNVLSGIIGLLSTIFTIAFYIGLPLGSTSLSFIFIFFIVLSKTTSNVIYKGYLAETFIYLGAAIFVINPYAVTVAFNYKSLLAGTNISALNLP